MKDTMVKSYECPICHEEITAEKLVILPEDEHELHEELLGNIGDHMFSCHEAKRTPDAEQLKARIEELEKLAVVWNKYPDEKPPESGIEYLVLIDGEIPRLAVYGHHVLYEDDTMNKWYSDEGPAKEPVPYGETEITHWAYLPDMPEEEK